MKVTVSQESLNKALSTVARALGRSPIPVLSGIYFDAQADRLTLRASDMALTIQTSLPCTVHDSGNCVIDGKRITDLVRRLDFDDVTLTRNENNSVTVKAGKSQYTLTGFDGETYPSLPDVTQAATLSISQGELKRMLHQTNFAVSSDDNKPWLSGVKATLKENQLLMMATNGERLALVSAEVNNENTERFGVIVPGSAASEVAKLISGDDKPMQMRVAHNGVWFEFGDVMVHSRLVEGEYPDILRFVPSAPINEVVLDRRELLEALGRVSAVVGSGVKFSITDLTLTLTSNKADSAAGSEELTVKSAGDNVWVILSASYLMNYLRTLDSVDVRLWLENERRPVCVKPADSEESTYMVMPMLLMP